MKVQRILHKNKVYTAAIIAFLTLSMALTIIPIASAAAAITLTPTTQGQDAPVTVDGTGFGATRAVGIGFGAETQVTGEVAPTATGSGVGPWTSRIAHYPIKPGSFVLQSNVEGVIVDYTDNGDGTLSSTSTYFVSGTINYVTGVFSRISTTDLSTYTIVHTCGYIYYQYNVTPAAGVTTLASGAFAASITVPNVANGIYAVTAVDTSGKRATSDLTVGPTIPEGITIGVMVLLSSVAMIVGARYFRKHQKPQTTAENN